MTGRKTTLLILSLTLVALMAMTAFGARQPVDRRVINPRVNKVMQYTFPYPDENHTFNGTGTSIDSKASLGQVMSAGTPSPGQKIGDTWYDYQHNGTMCRMIDVADIGGTALVHMAWMRLPKNPDLDATATRAMEYNYYDASSASLGGQTAASSDWAGYCGLDAVGDGRAMVAGHERIGQTFQGQAYWDDSPAAQFFLKTCRIPDSLAEYAGPGQSTIGNAAQWPKFRYQETTPDTVLHMFCQIGHPNPGDPQEIYYIRKVGPYTNTDCGWDYPPYVVDTIFDISQDVACSEVTGKVALVWTGNITGSAVCDTNSGEATAVQLDNDIYYQISDDQGVTWHPRVNLTCNVDGEAGYRPYTDLSALMTSDENLHIVWSGRVWPADANTGGTVGFDCRIFHWSEDVPQIRTVHNAEWDQEVCNGGAWQMNVSKMSVSECDGRIYVLFVQFNDIPNGVTDDCAQRGIDGSDVVGSANGDLWICVSADNGLTWDQARNLTNSYSPGCDSLTGAVGPCESDHWPSMVRYGRQNTVDDDWGGAVYIDYSAGTVVPYAGDHYLDIQWIHDLDPGGIVQNEGTWQLNDVYWARIPCAQEVPNPLLNLSVKSIGYPTWTKPTAQLDVPLVVENSGNVDLSYTYTVNEENGPTGWLDATGLTSPVPSGLGNIINATIQLNKGGIVALARAPEPTTILKGNITFTSNAPTSPDVLPITLYVADTLYVPTWDTLSNNNSFSLAVSTNGNYGQQGRGEVNMDFWNFGDCDTVDSIPGATEIYLYDGSPIVSVDSLTAYWSLFSDGFESQHGLRQIEPHTAVVDQGSYLEYYTGIFTTADTSIAMEKTWYFPNDGSGTWAVQCIKFYSYDGQTHDSLSLGEAIDWDIPADSGSDNTSDIDASRNLVYQQGFDWGDDGALQCQDNSNRFGGAAFLEKFEAGKGDPQVPDTLTCYISMATTRTGLADLQAQIDAAAAFYSSTVDPGAGTADWVGTYSADNATWVYPSGSFVSWEIRRNMLEQNATDQLVNFTDSVTDLHMVMTYVNNYELGGAGCCIGIRGNANGDFEDKVTISDVTYLIKYLFGIPQGPAPACQEEGNANGDFEEKITISDVTYLIKYLFGIPQGPAPGPCP